MSERHRERYHYHGANEAGGSHYEIVHWLNSPWQVERHHSGRGITVWQRSHPPRPSVLGRTTRAVKGEALRPLPWLQFGWRGV